MYAWRKMNPAERRETLAARKRDGKPWHSVPFIDSGRRAYMLTAACYEHRPHIGYSRERIGRFRDALLGSLSEASGLEELIAWVILPNHYHLLCHASNIATCKRALGKLHGRTSFEWNKEESERGRKVWFKAAETVMKSDDHYWATVNYIHQNPVRHRCVNHPEEWEWSSFREWTSGIGNKAMSDLEGEFPVDDYGRGWDDEDLSGWSGGFLGTPK